MLTRCDEMNEVTDYFNPEYWFKPYRVALLNALLHGFLLTAITFKSKLFPVSYKSRTTVHLQ